MKQAKNMLARIYVPDVMVHVNFFLDAQITKLIREKICGKNRLNPFYVMKLQLQEDKKKKKHAMF